jgi:hypothetical protein
VLVLAVLVADRWRAAPRAPNEPDDADHDAAHAKAAVSARVSPTLA